MSDVKPYSPFNSPLETGIRSIGVLTAAFPQAFDLQRLVAFDHLVVHTGDIGGPASLHPRLPMRSTELLVRRGLVERGILLFVSRGLIERAVTQDGIAYRAGEFSETFLLSLTTSYTKALIERAKWVVQEFGMMPDEEFQSKLNSLFEKWTNQFQATQTRLEPTQ